MGIPIKKEAVSTYSTVLSLLYLRGLIYKLPLVALLHNVQTPFRKTCLVFTVHRLRWHTMESMSQYPETGLVQCIVWQSIAI